MIACNVKQMSKEVSPHFSGDDVAKIRNFSRARSKVSVWTLRPITCLTDTRRPR